MPVASPFGAASVFLSGAVVAGIVFALALGALIYTRSTGGIALLWPGNAVVVAWVVRARRPSRPAMLGASVLALAAANLVANDLTPLTLLLPLIDAIEIVVMAAAIIRWRIDARTMPGLASLVGAAIVSAAVSALLSASAVALVARAPIEKVAFHWFASNLMGLIVLLPLLLAIRRSDVKRLSNPGEALAAAAIGLGTAALAVVVFYRAHQPMLFLLMPCMVFATFRLRFIGTSIAVAAIMAIGSAATTAGYGPIAVHFPPDERMLFLQAFIAIAALATFPVAIALSQMGNAFRRVREAQHQLQLLTENANDMIMRIGLDGTRHYVSPASERILGLRPEEMVGRSALLDIHPDDRDRVAQTFLALLEGGTDRICTYRKCNREGEYVWLEAAYRLVESDGRPPEFVASVRDVSRRHAAEQAAARALAEVEERERLLGMSEKLAKIGTWRINWIDRSVFWSPEVYRIHGLPADYVPTSATALQAYHPDDRERVEALVVRSIETGEQLQYQARIVQPSGDVRWAAASGQAERASDGTVVGLFGVFQDITDQVETLRAVTGAREEAEAALAAKAQFTATITHEIRTPLTSILGTAALLRTSTDDHARQRHLDTLERSGHLLAGIVDDVLLFSKLSEGHGQPEAIDFNVRDVVNDVVTVFANDAAAKGLSIATGGIEQSHWVTGDPARFARVLTNLVSNALKFTQDGGVAITVRPPGDGIVWSFDVEDTGVGIRPDRVDAIFESFVQADASITRNHGGTGLGLSISRMLVESMGGEISVERGLYRGACFRFTLPLAPAPAASDAKCDARSDAGKRVLLAEDNDTNRYLIAELVRRLGHEVVTVSDGAAAVSLLDGDNAGRFDIVLMDVEMPVKDGVQAASEIRERRCGTKLPIFALTADGSAERRRTIIDAGMNGLLVKPVDLNALARVIDGIPSDGVPTSDARDPAERPAIDPDRVRGLEATLDRQARDLLLTMLMGDAEEAPQRIREHMAAGRIDQARREAHGLRGAAASVGAHRLVDALMQIELGAANQEVSETLLARLDEAAIDVVSAARSMLETSDDPREVSLSSSN